MTPDIWFYCIAGLAVLIAGISKGGFGSGGAFVATPLIALVVEPAVALGLMLPLLMIMDVATMRAYWRKWSTRDAVRLCLGAIPGVAVAAFLHHLTNPDIFRFLIGTISLVFVVFQLAKSRGLIKSRDKPYGAGAGIFTGSVAGFTSFVSHAGGPPVLMYLLSQHLTKVSFQATTVLTFWFINIIKVVPYAVLGFLTLETLWNVAALAPIALIGVWIGIHAHRVLPERPFFIITYVLLTIAGCKLIFDAVT